MEQRTDNNRHASSFVQMSEILHEKYLKSEKTGVIKLVFRLEGLPDFIHYFSSGERIDNFTNVSNESQFEFEFTKISGDPGAPIQPFKEYLKDLEVKEKIVVVSS